jgi:benzoylformate decarboxylase
MTTVREITIDLLRKLGMTSVFGNPGSTELPMFRDFPEDFRYVLGLQESVALAMADGFAQATRNAALVNLHSSAGTGHALGNLFTAYKNQTPLVVTAGQQARSILPFEPFLFAERACEFPRPFVKWSCEPARAADVPRAILRGYRIAMTPPYGPVFISVPVDDWDQPCDPLEFGSFAARNPGDPAELAELARSLSEARSPALVLGAGCARQQAWDAVVQLAQAQGTAVYVAPFASRNVFPEDHRLFQGCLPASRERIVETLANHDLVIAVGGPLNLYHTEGNGPHLPQGTKVWLITDDPGLLSFAPGDRAILADPRYAVETLARLATPPSARAEVTPRDTSGTPDAPDGGLCEAHVMDSIARLRPLGSVIVEEAPSSRPAMQRGLPILDPDGFYTTAGGGLGYGLPAAVGIALARRDSKVIALLGDGSAMYAIQGLFSAAKLGAAVSFLIVNNRSYAALRQFGGHFGLENVEGSDLAGLDFCAIAQGHGVAAKRATTPDELEAALQWSFDCPKPTLVEMILA